MRRRTRVDLGQQASSAKEETILDRKRKRWAERNKDKDPEENPFLLAIKPDQANFGDGEDERGEELRKRLSNLEFGNFPGYFNYRNKATVQDKSDDNVKSPQQSGDNQAEEKQPQEATTPAENPLESGMSDERLKFFKPEWFAGKEVLDIGCNRGHITYAVARLYNPASIVGIDIDAKMINMANKDLHLHLEDGLISMAKEELRQKAISQRLQDGDNITLSFPLSSYINDGPLLAPQESKHSSATGEDELKRSSENEVTTDNPESASTSTMLANKFPNNILFVEHNYVLSRDELAQKQRPHFDTVVCLSVTKWIHLNYCDSGLKRFFKRIYKHLRPGGLLILETQPFDNYGRRKKLSDRLKANFYSIQFKPNQFDEYLLSSEVGFKRIVYESVTDHRCAGFKRPLKVFLK